MILVNMARLTTTNFFSLFLSLQKYMYLRNMLVVCGITDLHNPERKFSTNMFIDIQGFTGIDNFTIIFIKDILNMIKDNNLVPNQESRLDIIQQCKLQALVWWVNDFQCRSLAITAPTWTAADLTSSIMQINIESQSGGGIKVIHPVKVETRHKWMIWDFKWGNYIGSMVGLLVIPLYYVTHCDRPVVWTAANEHYCIKYQAINIGSEWESDKMTVYTKLKACCLDGKGRSWIKA